MSDSQMERLVAARTHEPGGPWYVELSSEKGPEVCLGPYGNPAIAEQDAKKVRGFVASLLARQQEESDSISEHDLFS